MADEEYMRQVQTSVTNFIYCGDEYLFLKRSITKRIDPGRLNGIGGRVDAGEDILSAVIRETKEETGYEIAPEDIQLTTIGRLEGGYSEDWMMFFFKTRVKSKEVPNGMASDDGELLWLHKDRVLDSDYDLVDDLNYCFKDIVAGDSIAFFNAQVNDEEKIARIEMSKLARG